QTLSKGVRACVLYDNGIVSSALVEFDPGTRLPSHRHFAHEECVVLRGSLSTGDLRVGAQDYHLAPSGSRHPSIGSEEGALIFLRGTSIGKGARMVREMLSAWLPGRGAQPITIRADDDNWRVAGEGVRVKPLWRNEGSTSVLVSLAPGGRLPGYAQTQEEECLTVSGEVFMGDILLRTGEYQMAPRATTRDEITSDVGGLLFLHTSADFANVS
ncbi:MAG: chrR Cupin-like domain protein, partial [Rhodocyclales bacterium]|nr:chrR Cupin-like domain protein [Rhodocyclales bacterium]